MLTATQRANLERWCADLESGRYTQTQNELCSLEDKMCCLGVGMIQMIETGVVTPWDGSRTYERSDGSNADIGCKYVKLTNLAPDDARRWDYYSGFPPLKEWEAHFGIDPTALIPVPSEPGASTLVAMNDSHKRTFAEIAAAIRAHYLA